MDRNCSIGKQNKEGEINDEDEQKEEGQGEVLTPQKLNDYRDLIGEVYRVSKLYKRKSKKVRNSSIQAPIYQHNKKKDK